MNASTEKTGIESPIVRSLADAAGVGMAFVLKVRADETRRFVFASTRCLGVNGVTAEAAMADANLIFDLILPEHRAAFDAAEAKARERLEPFDVEVAMVGPSGETRWRRFTALPRPQADGSMMWDGLQLDITERRRMAETMREQRRRLEVAVEATGLGFWEWDVEADSLTWSERNKELYGLAPDAEVSLERYLELVHPEDLPQVQAAYAEARDKPNGGDYSLEHRIVRPDGDIRWILAHGRVSTHEPGKTRLVVGTSLDVTERKAADEGRALLVGELAHRAKNGIAIIMAIVTGTARGQETVESFRDLLMARLQAMANSQDLVTASGGRPVGLTDVIANTTAVFDPGRFDIDPALARVMVRGDMALGMGLLLHELATNAVKYGALSNTKGRVAISSQPADAGRVAFEWREAGGPPVKPPVREGFGTRLLHQALRNQTGKVKFDFEPHGFSARVEFPV